MSRLVDIITAADPAARNLPLETACRGLDAAGLLGEAAALDAFRRQSDNLYERVRALFFLYAIHRFHLPPLLPSDTRGLVPHEGYEHLLNRRFEEAIDVFRAAPVSDGIASALPCRYCTWSESPTRDASSVATWQYSSVRSMPVILHLKAEASWRDAPPRPLPTSSTV